MNTKDVGVGRAHAKSILFGEHAVVYGAPAVALPLPDLGVTVRARRSGSMDGQVRLTEVTGDPAAEPDARMRFDPGLSTLIESFRLETEISCSAIDLGIDCAIPFGRGLGSSAACARAVVLALADLFDVAVDARFVFDLVQTSERAAHGSPSGVDTVATGSPVPIWFRGGAVKELAIGVDAVFVVADSGVSSSTKTAVARLRETFDADPPAKSHFLRESSRITAAAVEDMARGRVRELGRRLTDNHELLSSLDLSTIETDRLVDAALATGCAGAKLSGGGLGGCVVALVGPSADVTAVTETLHAAGATATWTATTGCPPGRPASKEATWSAPRTIRR
ncbi:mevalonate kinase [Nocardia sp. CDC159]|uniref:mevalonate kinase n=1 Tax=Nocardia pulmonis TaxID=2951408 RepID=A0A9X2EIH3_9NOCA|nr:MULTISPECIES: mevalonate kinase [Nocardia]MCM6778681.1 mevalonate kinase [Nocardia pulmonis]MCM6791570.1 mevalonate kinase [Nocardia sp. CDC159]